MAMLGYLVKQSIFWALLCVAGWSAYNIRLYALKDYGMVIHEFDPWFNFRATQYLADNGWTKFFTWFDYMSWYPLGRPVGTTIYPGMQITAVALWNSLNYLGVPISLNDVCCYVPAWFGVSATTFLALLASECSGSWAAGVGAAGIMSVIPAHIMRSVGGGYDNESIALTAMCLTFYMWVRSLRHDPKATDGQATRDSVIFGALAGLAYINMVAAWGGFVFVLNLIGVHAGLLCAAGRFTSKLHRAYSLFFVIGTLGAIRVPVVGMKPFKDFEQLGPMVVFLGMQLLEYVEVQRRKQKLTLLQVFQLRVKVFAPVVVAVAAVVMALLNMGYFGPLSARVRGLFVKHTRTGNPLVDSVAEHQPASERAYSQYLHHIYYLAPAGFVVSMTRWTDANLFLIAYALIAYFFSSKMARLIILLGPVASALGGVAIGFVVDQCFLFASKHLATAVFCPPKVPKIMEDSSDKETKKEEETKTETKKDAKNAKGGKGKKGDKKAEAKAEPPKKKIPKKKKKEPEPTLGDKVKGYQASVMGHYNSFPLVLVRVALGLYAVKRAVPLAQEFYDYSHELAVGMSQPSIMFKAKLRDGTEIIVDDYREAYHWLRDNTPEDSRVMAWWDYGYQITGIGNRTTIADGNTWNHEHIATLGRALSANEKKAHRIAKHLADYVLVWAGGGGDDLAKSPHMARIGNSVYPDICPGDPTCSTFGFYQGGKPTKMMEESLLYKLTQFGIRPEIKLSPSRFTLAFSSKYGKCRIFKVQNVDMESRAWVADPANRLCDKPGSWYCPGQYPPALHSLIAKRKSFKQVEDFNAKKTAEDEAYHEAYMAGMAGKRPKSEGSTKEESPVVAYVGCYSSEKAFGSSATYGGGVAGASLSNAADLALANKDEFMAVARLDKDGHSFSFASEPGDTYKVDDGECNHPCLGQENTMCGCTNDACGSLPPAEGESDVRRWAVYHVSSPEKKDKKKKKKKKKEL